MNKGLGTQWLALRTTAGREVAVRGRLEKEMQQHVASPCRGSYLPGSPLNCCVPEAIPAALTPIRLHFRCNFGRSPSLPEFVPELVPGPGLIPPGPLRGIRPGFPMEVVENSSQVPEN
jgi:hypothetical protein